jgi:hypothetical protein
LEQLPRYLLQKLVRVLYTRRFENKGRWVFACPNDLTFHRIDKALLGYHLRQVMKYLFLRRIHDQAAPKMAQA